MSRCIQLAKNGLGNTYPNPLVGCVIVLNNRIIGEGWHKKAGQPHAEVNAIENVTNKINLANATLYVSLEPCNHFGATPPCTDLIIRSGIKKVVIGSTDPNPKVNGSGIQRLKAAGCEVIDGILRELCDETNKRFFTFHLKKRPFIILKWAQTKDGFMAPLYEHRGVEKKPFWISNRYSRQLTHKIRSEEQAILVGTTTVLMDNPSLTTRDWEGNSPIRIVIDRMLKIPSNAAIFSDDKLTIVFTEKVATSTQFIRYETLLFSNNIVTQICKVLYQYAIQSVLVEGGYVTLQSFIDANCWDEAYVFTSETVLKEGLKTPCISGSLISEDVLKDNTLQFYKNPTH